ncbi:hypothetical protein BN405_2-10_Ab1_orf_142 [Pseudomonas phage vB_PaeM_C2-10_Ab1]|uniref:Uncharacterized protein n=3 Tax=Pakpunavirus TaxID=1921407 RepID=K4RLJ1_9CAUD|nr:hypothetical protein BN405_2-10_Ab1_orf_142 [Pseudomonas phage vB_PaeM_C2-10_Ab1]YP_009623563.1 hypothetical protein FDJ38_gp070 [Pseudomonas phage vB_PaeM_C2-10_Ab02]CCM43686.1 unnamed protein product [Pseudomonas phage vB_PaeM_C2-10_Ab1]CEF89086.1 hypothetical protein [Pseudomonas phage vB_PaeM_C2-10_Ab02]CEF89471.1 hypothetical protein [Pseudomonas phage vB_PaeM_C2-10_Ab08]
MKISAILKNNLKFYKNNSFMCALAFDNVSRNKATEVQEFIHQLLGPFVTLHAKLKKEIPGYERAVYDDEPEDEMTFFVSDRAYQMRRLWWETVIEQLEEQGQ